MGFVRKMDFDRNIIVPRETPESSWSEITTPSSDDIEEIVRLDDQASRPPTKDLAYLPRCMRRAIRRRLKIEERLSRGENITNSFSVTTLDMRRSMDGSEGSSSSNYTIITPATSSCTDPWSPGFVEEGRDANGEKEDQDEEMVLPKLEPIDDDVDMTYLKDNFVPETPSASTSPVTPKRGRGRPRKLPKVSPDAVVKVVKGRSKTGCITCRRRKKKCDEAKPGCELEVYERDLCSCT
jgi:hypothetical protein